MTALLATDGMTLPGPGEFATAAAAAPVSDTSTLIAFFALAVVAVGLATALIWSSRAGSRALQAVYRETQASLVGALGDRAKDEREQLKVIAEIGPALRESTDKVTEILARELGSIRTDQASINSRLANLETKLAAVDLLKGAGVARRGGDAKD